MRSHPSYFDFRGQGQRGKREGKVKGKRKREIKGKGKEGKISLEKEMILCCNSFLSFFLISLWNVFNDFSD